MKNSIKIAAIALAGSTLMLQGCNDTNNDDDNMMPKAYSITVTNLTNHQPLAPIGVILHGAGYHAYTLGSAASNALETLAESGDNSMLLSAANNEAMVLATASGSGVITPGASETITVEGMSDTPQLSLAGMLVNTNDGFAAIDAANISVLAAGEHLTLYAKAYDAGTEANSESAMDVPGQGGEGFNAARNDHDFVSVHSGIVSMDDGLTSSALDQSHRFDNPIAKIMVTRMQ